MNIDTKSPVCVTGATGYVAGVLVKELLDAGLTVHAAIRDPSKTERLKYLTDIADATSGSIKFFKADLLDEGSYTESMQGCSVVFHTASPFVMSVPKGKEQEMLLDPAVKGTQNVLKSAAETSSVKRVVLTSSVYAVAVDAQDSLDVEKCDESVWNTAASVKYNPYAYSKVLAEKAAWEIAKAEDTKYDLVVINPSWVMGPGVKAHPSSESYGFVTMLGNGAMKSGCPKMGVWVVDVRDVAQAHLKAAFMEGAEGRNIISGGNTDMLKMADAILAKYPDYPLPKKALPKFLVWLLGPLLGMPRRMVSRSCNVEAKLDNSKSVESLGMKYKPLEDTMQDMFKQMIEAGLINDPTGKK
ncbi:hypothetical protein ACHAXT_004327 [Thalassiosira profunda]